MIYSPIHAVEMYDSIQRSKRSYIACYLLVIFSLASLIIKLFKTVYLNYILLFIEYSTLN